MWTEVGNKKQDIILIAQNFYLLCRFLHSKEYRGEHSAKALEHGQQVEVSDMNILTINYGTVDRYNAIGTKNHICTVASA